MVLESHPISAPPWFLSTVRHALAFPPVSSKLRRFAYANVTVALGNHLKAPPLVALSTSTWFLRTIPHVFAHVSYFITMPWFIRAVHHTLRAVFPHHHCRGSSESFWFLVILVCRHGIAYMQNCCLSILSCFANHYTIMKIPAYRIARVDFDMGLQFSGHKYKTDRFAQHRLKDASADDEFRPIR